MLKNPAPTNKKEMQRVTGRLATLGLFIACFTNKLRLFFTTLRGAHTFGWTDECTYSFEVIKHYLIEPPILSSIIHVTHYVKIRYQHRPILTCPKWREKTCLQCEQSFGGHRSALLSSGADNASITNCY